MIDITTIDDLGNITYILNIKFRFKGFNYLVADKYGNFFILPHCPNKRTITFKHLGRKKDFIYYHGVKKYMPELRRKRVFVEEKIGI